MIDFDIHNPYSPPSVNIGRASDMYCLFSSLVYRAMPLLLSTVFLTFTGCNLSRDIPGGKAVDVTKFGEDLTAEDFILVKFGATWCGPCQIVEKELDSLDSEKLGVKIIKVDVDQQPELSSQFGINGIPHLMLVRNGKTLVERRGAQTADELTSWIQHYQ